MNGSSTEDLRLDGSKSARKGKDDVKKRRRRGAPKVRSGCSTCKKRHVKCGEERPACRQCESQGWTCDGYASGQQLEVARYTRPRSTTSRTEITQLAKTLTTVLIGSHQDNEYFHHFHSQAAPEFAGHFGSTFWTSYIPQSCTTRPAVLLAVVAVGALHHEFLQSESVHASCDRQMYSSVLHVKKYNNALQCLNRRIISDDPEILEETLTTCLLFIVYEVLRGDNLAALVHLKGGLQTLRSFQARFSATAQTGVRRERNSHNAFLEQVAHCFVRLDIQASSLVDGAVTNLPLRVKEFAMANELEQPSDAFTTIEQARDSLMKQLSAMYDFLQFHSSHWKYELSTPTPNHVLADRQQQMNELAHWLHNFSLLLQNQRGFTNLADTQSCHILRMQYLASLIRLSTSLEPEETAYDQFLREFQEIVELGSFVLASRIGPKVPKFTFVVDLGAIYPLYFTAFKCRCHQTRWRAIELLKVAGREGPWDGVRMALIAAKIASLEERGTPSTANGEVPENLRIHGAVFPINANRGQIGLECCSKVGKESQDWIWTHHVID